MLGIKLVSGGVKNYFARVSRTGALLTEQMPVPPRDINTLGRIYRQFLTDDGTSGGSSDMRVAASAANPSDFFVTSLQESDLYITSISFLISDAGAGLNEFGAITALTNGCRLFYEDNSGDVVIHGSLQSNFDFVRLCHGEPAFGSGPASFIAPNVISTSEALIPTLSFRDVFGLPWGIKLNAGEGQRITLRVQDDTSTVDAFNAIAYGFERLLD